jgi:drug/metabolite transporter (DMT)-like permease
MSYPVVVLLSGPMLGEHVRVAWAVAGLVFISAGVSFIGLGLGKSKMEAKPCKD